MPPASRKFVLRAAQVARQDRHHDSGQASHRSAARREHDGKFQAPDYGGANHATEVVLSSQPSVLSSQFSVVILSEAKDLLFARNSRHRGLASPGFLINLLGTQIESLANPMIRLLI